MQELYKSDQEAGIREALKIQAMIQLDSSNF